MTLYADEEGLKDFAGRLPRERLGDPCQVLFVLIHIAG